MIERPGKMTWEMGIEPAPMLRLRWKRVKKKRRRGGASSQEQAASSQRLM